MSQLISQFVSTNRSISFNLDQFEADKKHGTETTSYRSLLATTGSILYIH